ncbi:hypothetical protein [Micromonospora sp. NBC_01739]|uniref:hypothetical protein n=1 Tax=unclassified Micromonospora TaxID=2617518 RepID=UPI002E0DE3E0|nr:hypothetical protein OIE53_19815 [Micromonospora sp. NBC_01739]
MAVQKDVLEGTPIRPKAKDLQVGAVDALSALNLIVGVVRDVVQNHQTESTRREFLRTYRETEVARIKASQDALRDYFDQVYAERRDIHQRLFASLDQALEAGDVGAVQAVVGGIVEVARTSPLADVGNLIDLKRAMDDPSTVWQL